MTVIGENNQLITTTSNAEDNAEFTTDELAFLEEALGKAHGSKKNAPPQLAGILVKMHAQQAKAGGDPQQKDASEQAILDLHNVPPLGDQQGPATPGARY